MKKILFLKIALLFTILNYGQVHIGNSHTITTDYLIEVRKGRVDGHSIVNKFGRNGNVGTNLGILTIGGVYETPLTAKTLEILSADADDTIAGLGAQKVVLEGLDSNYDIQIDTVSMNGLTPVTISKQFIRLFRSYVIQSGVYATSILTSHQGQITIRESGAGPSWLILDTVEETASGSGIGQSQIGVYAIPRGYTGYLLSKSFSIESTKPASVYFFKRENIDDITAPFTSTMRLFEQNDGLEGFNVLATNVPIEVFPELTELGFFAKVAVGTASISCEFQLLLIKN